MEKLKFYKKQYLEKDDLKRINCLMDICLQEEELAYKLELDYKYLDGLANKNSNCENTYNEFFCYTESDLIGYLGICQFGGGDLEISGMVHPDYRRHGVFSRLLEMAKAEARERKIHSMLILSDSRSKSAMALIENIEAVLERREFEMSFNLNNKNYKTNHNKDVNLHLATKKDALEVYKQNYIYENNLIEENNVPHSLELENPEEEHKKNVYTYLIKLKNEFIGKIHLNKINEAGWIYGFFIYPNFRGKGYAKDVLKLAYNIFKEQHVKEMFLQVDASNQIAFSLYKSFGFSVLYSIDYYHLNF